MSEQGDELVQATPEPTKGSGPWVGSASLYDFNAKFDPDWLPRVIVYEDGADLPRVSILYAGIEGFLNVPVIGHLLVPQVVTEAVAS
jgi:lysyl-tRNA synthetase, class II